MIDSIPAKWQQLLKIKECVDKEPFTVQNQIELNVSNNEKIPIRKCINELLCQISS